MTARETYEIWLKNATPDERAELEAIKDDPAEIADRFGADLEFGTAGLRGIVGLGTRRMNVYTVARATAGLAEHILSLGEDAARRGVVISYDTRRFSLEFAKKTAATLSARRIRAFLFNDVRPVPMCSYAVRALGAIAGVMITASHNPKEYNGYKVYGEDGAQMDVEDTTAILSRIREIPDLFAIKCDDIAFPDSFAGLDGFKLNDCVTVIGKTVDEGYYSTVLRLSASPEAVKEFGPKIKLVYTPIHGAGYVPVTTVLRRLGINVACVKEQTVKDTEFSTVALPNPEDRDALKMGIELGNEIGADVVIGTDPDCDRMGLAIRDSSGKFALLHGNAIGALLMDYVITRLRETNAMPKNPAVVKTIVTTALADRIAEANGVASFDVLTGFKYIGAKIREWERTGEYSFVFGYEESYGSLRGTHARDKDAVVASMLTAEMVCYYASKGMTLNDRLNQIYERYGYYKEAVESVRYEGIRAMAEMTEAMSEMRNARVSSIAGEPVLSASDYLTRETVCADGRREPIDLPQSDVLKYNLADGQFVCVRPSGTEPKLKIYALCRSANGMPEAEAKSIAMLADIKKTLGI